MGYAHIENLYRDKAKSILLFKEVYCLEKIHGTSAHISWNDGKVGFFSGGANHESFVSIMDSVVLSNAFAALGHDKVIVYGEAYGGKMQGMKHTYGNDLKFAAFDVLVNNTWLKVPDAHDVAIALELEFVHYIKSFTYLKALDAERDAPSEQAFRNGMADRNDPATYKLREGIVLRPLIEVTDNRGNRIVAKHKGAAFSERVHVPKVNAEKDPVMEEAEKIAFEFVTDQRLAHVLDKLGNPKDLSFMPTVIPAMIEDVLREASGEILDNKLVRKEIGRATVKLYKNWVTKI